MQDIFVGVAVVVEADNGLEYGCIEFLLSNGLKVYVVCQDPWRGELAVEKLNSLGYEGLAIMIHARIDNEIDIELASKEILEKEKQVSTIKTSFLLRGHNSPLPCFRA